MCVSVVHIRCRTHEQICKRKSYEKFCERNTDYEALGSGHACNHFVHRLVAFVYVPINKHKHPNTTCDNLMVDRMNANHFDNDYR